MGANPDVQTGLGANRLSIVILVPSSPLRASTSSISEHIMKIPRPATASRSGGGGGKLALSKPLPLSFTSTTTESSSTLQTTSTGVSQSGLCMTAFLAASWVAKTMSGICGLIGLKGSSVVFMNSLTNVSADGVGSRWHLLTFRGLPPFSCTIAILNQLSPFKISQYSIRLKRLEETKGIAQLQILEATMLIEMNGKTPVVAPDAFVAPTAVLIGDVVVESGASVWWGAVIRADWNSIRIGPRTSVQDNCVVHCTAKSPATVGADVTVGHAAVLHGCTVEDGALIGINSTVLDDAVVGEEAVVSAGSVVTPGTQVQPGWLVGGVPSKPIKELSEKAKEAFKVGKVAYEELARQYLRSGAGARHPDRRV